VLFSRVYTNPHLRLLFSFPPAIAFLSTFPQHADVSLSKFPPPPKFALTHLDATLATHPTSVASKGLIENLTPVEATLTKYTGVGDPHTPFRSQNGTLHCCRSTLSCIVLFSPLVARLSPLPPLCFHTLTHSFALFCTLQKRNSILSRNFHTLAQKHPGWVWPSQVCIQSSPCHLCVDSFPLATRLPQPGRGHSPLATSSRHCLSAPRLLG